MAILLAYFVGGLLVLFAFDVITHRLRDKFRDKVAEANVVMAQQGNVYVGRRMMLVTFALITWLFWPAILIGAATDRKDEDEQKGKEDQDEQEDKGSIKSEEDSAESPEED